MDVHDCSVCACLTPGTTHCPCLHRSTPRPAEVGYDRVLRDLMAAEARLAAVQVLHVPWYEVGGVRHDFTVMLMDEPDEGHVCRSGVGVALPDRESDRGSRHKARSAHMSTHGPLGSCMAATCEGRFHRAGGCVHPKVGGESDD